TRRRTAKAAASAPEVAEHEAPVKKPRARRTTKAAAVAETDEAKPVAKTRRKTKAADEGVVQPIVIEDAPPAGSRRTGWWRR
ncbi:hypothetical protein, partial [Ameyamaea chiangmaiensis]